jgi:outer membrane murein-binding lipoprotein Lpp
MSIIAAFIAIAAFFGGIVVAAGASREKIEEGIRTAQRLEARQGEIEKKLEVTQDDLNRKIEMLTRTVTETSTDVKWLVNERKANGPR